MVDAKVEGKSHDRSSVCGKARDFLEETDEARFTTDSQPQRCVRVVEPNEATALEPWVLTSYRKQ